MELYEITLPVLGHLQCQIAQIQVRSSPIFFRPDLNPNCCLRYKQMTKVEDSSVDRESSFGAGGRLWA